MKNLNKLALLVASAAMAISAGCATSNSQAPGTDNNWANGDNTVQWRTGDGQLCWRDSSWTPDTANQNCDGAVVQGTEVVTIIQQDVVQPTPTSQKVQYSADTFFDFDKATLKPAGKQALDELIRRMGGMQSIEVVVATGYTDSTGPAAYNEKLSLRRAESVKAYMVERGVPSNLIYVEGKGEADPIASNKTREGRAENRRVEIEVVGYTK